MFNRVAQTIQRLLYIVQCARQSQKLFSNQKQERQQQQQQQQHERLPTSVKKIFSFF